MYDGLQGVYHRASKYLYNQIIKLQAGIIQYFQFHREARLLVSEILSKCRILKAHMISEVEASHIHLVATTYGEALSSSWRAECCTVVLKMIKVIWREMSKVRVES